MVRSRSSDVKKQLLGVWKLESWYTEIKETGEKKRIYGKKPNTDEDRVAAFRSMTAYSGIYRVDGDRWITKVDVAWNETRVGMEQMRFFKLEGDKLMVTAMWQPSVNLPGNPEARGVLVWSRVKAQ